MALRDQPYLPLYVQDFLTDEKLAECSAAATGVMIRLMCLMHKSTAYGRILLRQKYRQGHDQVACLAAQLCRQMPYDQATVAAALKELLLEEVIALEGDGLVQRRMVRDNDLSCVRAAAGRKGGERTLGKLRKKTAVKSAQAKPQAKAEYANADEYENDPVNGNGLFHPPADAHGSCDEAGQAEYADAGTGAGVADAGAAGGAPGLAVQHPAGEEWRESFDIYLGQLREAYAALQHDADFITAQQRYHPGVNIPLTMEKACVNFWATPDGWQHKLYRATGPIDWKATLTKAISQPQNKVYDRQKSQRTSSANDRELMQAIAAGAARGYAEQQ